MRKPVNLAKVGDTTPSVSRWVVLLRKRRRELIVVVGMPVFFTAFTHAQTLPTPVAAPADQEANWLVVQIRRFRSYPHLHRAYRLLNQDNLEEAADEMRAYLAIQPADEAVQHTFLNVLYRQKKTGELFREAERILANNPRNASATLYRGLACQLKGDTEGALANFRRVYENTAASREDRIFSATTAADISMAKDRYLDALTALTVLLSLQNDYFSHYRRGDALRGLGNIDEAEKAFELALAQAGKLPEKIEVLSALGYLAQKKSDTEKATRYGEALLELDPANLDWLREMAITYYSKGRHARAENMARRALAVSNAVQDRIYLANVLAEARSYAAAIEQYKKVAWESKDPESVFHAQMGLGYAYQATGNQPAARSAFANAVQIHRVPTALAGLAATGNRPGVAVSHPVQAVDVKDALAAYQEHPTADGAASIGYTYAQTGNVPKAVSYLEQALKTTPQPEWKLHLAELYARLGDRDNAEKHLRDLAPTTAGDWRRITEAYLKTGNKAQAIAALEKVANSPGDYLQIGQLHNDLRQYDQALAAFQQVLTWRGERPVQIQAQRQAQRQIGYLCVELGQDQKAAAAFQAALDNGDNDPATRKALGFLFLKMKKYPLAHAQFVAALDTQYTAENMLILARIQSAMQQPEQALRYYKMAESKSGELQKTTLAELHAELGYVYAGKGDVDLADRHWQVSAASDNTPDSQMRLAHAEEMRGLHDQALARLSAIAQRPLDKEQSLHLHEQTAQVLEKAGKIDAAARQLELAAALQPSAERQYRLGMLAIRRKDPRAARRHLENAMNMAPDNLQYVQQLAYLSKEQGDAGRAIQLFEQVVAQDPTRVVLYQDLAYAHTQAGNNDKAVYWFKKAIDSKIGIASMPDLRSYLVEPESMAQGRRADEEQVVAMREQVREMSRRYQFNAYQSYRANTRQPLSSTTPGFVTGGIVPSQGGVELVFQPPGIGYQDGKTLRLFGRTLWSNQPKSLSIDTKTTQGGVGIEYKPFRDVNAYVSLEKLIRIGEQADDNWLVRGSWGYSDGYGLKLNQPSWNQTLFYTDIGYFLQRDKIRSVYAELRQGRSFNVNNTTIVTPHVTAAVRGQRPDPFDASYAEVGAGISIKYLFNETRYETARSNAELTLQYRKQVTNQQTGSWLVTTAFQY